MRLKRFSLFGVKDKFITAPASINLDELGAGLIAIVGPNGAGKTTTMEAPLASLYKTFASRPGSLYGKMAGRDAYLESVWNDAGREIKVRLSIDAEASKTEGYVFIDDQSRTSGRAAEFEKEIANLFGSRELFLASVFAAQNKAGNFLALPKSRRKELFIELLGLGHLTALSAESGNRRRSADALVGQQRALLGALVDEIADRDDISDRLTAEQASLQQLDFELGSLRTGEASLASLLQDAMNAAKEITALEQSLASATSDLRRAQAAADEVVARHNRTSLERQKQLDSWARLLNQNDEQQIINRFDSRRRSLRAREASLNALIAEEPVINASVGELDALYADAADINARLREFEGLKQQLSAAKGDLRVAMSEYNAADAARKSELTTLKRSSALLKQASCSTASLWANVDDPQQEAFDLARLCPLIANAQQAHDQLACFDESDFERRITIAEEAKSTTEAAVIRLENQIDDDAPMIAQLAARISEVARKEIELQKQVARRSLIEPARQELAQVQQELNGIGLEQEMELDDLRTKKAEAQAAIDQLNTEARAAEDSTEAELSEARQRVAQAQGVVEVRVADLDAARSRSSSLATVERELYELREKKGSLEGQLRTIQDGAARLKAKLEILEEKASQAETLRQEIVSLNQEVGDWALLETALGKDGVQALEIDAAGPEVSAITNELLESCYGPAFSISFETLREKKSAPGEFSEAFDIRVFKRGIEMDVEQLSGGEMVIVSEALSLALAIFNTRKSGIRFETLWRDETAGALWPENALAYVDMLRRARELGGYYQVLFVSHQPEVWAAADSQLFINDGKIGVEEAAGAA
jgi:exonuclease SbcC